MEVWNQINIYIYLYIFIYAWGIWDTVGMERRGRTAWWNCLTLSSWSVRAPQKDWNGNKNRWGIEEPREGIQRFFIDFGRACMHAGGHSPQNERDETHHRNTLPLAASFPTLGNVLLLSLTHNNSIPIMPPALFSPTNTLAPNFIHSQITQLSTFYGLLNLSKRMGIDIHFFMNKFNILSVWIHWTYIELCIQYGFEMIVNFSFYFSIFTFYF